MKRAPGTEDRRWKHLILLNDPPYGTERSFNGLRMAHALAKNDAEAEVTVFLIADAVLCAKAGQKTPDGYYNLERMIRRLLTAKGRVLMCGTCMDARGLTEGDMREEPTRSTMDELAQATLACGCGLLISITSSGQITPQGAPPYFILINCALRDEGTSYHYLPPSDWSLAPAQLLAQLDGVFGDGPRVLIGATWTTDAPFRATKTAIASARSRGILAVEMEAAGLYAFAQARGQAVICLAHVTNQMGTIEGDFEKGEANGTKDVIAVFGQIIARIGRDPQASTVPATRTATSSSKP